MMKRLMVVFALSVAAAFVFAGGQREGGTTPTATAAGMEKEAPMLAKLVTAGKLPPVEKRLPANPVVVKGKEIGKYGGTIRSPILGPYVFYGDPQSLVGPETILRISPDYKAIGPGLASYEFQNQGKTIVLKLVPDIKWSDGQPFTADDVLFWYDDIILNNELTPVKPAQWSPGGELMRMTKVDQYTVRLDFKEPYPIAIYLLAHYPGFRVDSSSPSTI